MKFDSNLAWKQASSAITANREVLVALAGVFFLLPSLAVSLLFPQPEATAEMGQQEALAAMSDFYLSALPVLIPMVLVQAAGTLAMLTLFTDLRRPTVGEAIRRGFTGVIPYFLAQIVLAFAIGVAGSLVLGLAAISRVPAIGAVGVAAVALLAVYVYIRTSLLAPVIAVEGARNPLAALQRSWRLTQGNTARLGVFYVLVGFAFVIILIVVMAVIGALVAIVVGPEAGQITSAIVSALLGTAMTLYFVAIFAAVHRQFAGPSAESMATPFE